MLNIWVTPPNATEPHSVSVGVEIIDVPSHAAALAVAEGFREALASHGVPATVLVDDEVEDAP